MAQGEANKVWLVPSDFGKALEGFTRMLGAPGEDGVFRFEPSPVDDAVAASRPEDDDELIKEWFDTAGDPALAKVVADAEAQARKAVPALGAPPRRRPAIPAHLPPPARPAADQRPGPQRRCGRRQRAAGERAAHPAPRHPAGVRRSDGQPRPGYPSPPQD